MRYLKLGKSGCISSQINFIAFIPVEDLITVYEALADTFEEDELEVRTYIILRSDMDWWSG